MKVCLKRKPQTETHNRNKQLPSKAYVTAFLRTSLFLDINLKHFSRENKIFTTSIIEVQDMKKV